MQLPRLVYQTVCCHIGLQIGKSGQFGAWCNQERQESPQLLKGRWTGKEQREGRWWTEDRDQHRLLGRLA